MVNIAIFASGNGSNFENIIQEINNGHVNNAVCKVLIIDKEHAYAKERAEKLHIPCVYVNPKAYAGKEPYEQKILSILKEHQVELIVLAGYMRFIGKVLLESFPRRIINLHPAYLPNFIHQEKITIDSTWSLETLEEHVHALEYDMFPKVIKHVCKMIESEEA